MSLITDGGRPTRKKTPWVVIDASVGLKWVLDDEDQVEQATGLRDAWLAGRCSAVAPSLWQYEVLNALVMAVRRKRLSFERSLQGMGYLAALRVRFADPSPARVHWQAVRYRITAYDGSYVALAEDLGAVLWTGDRRLVDSVGKEHDRVRWIGDWSE